MFLLFSVNKTCYVHAIYFFGNPEEKCCFFLVFPITIYFSIAKLNVSFYKLTSKYEISAVCDSKYYSGFQKCWTHLDYTKFGGLV